METYCIGLSGQKQVGKDTSANILIPLLNDTLERTFERVAFADAVKNMLCFFYYREEGEDTLKKVSRQWIEENKEKNDYIPIGWNMNIRDSLTNIGDRFREICPSIWIDIALKTSSRKNKILTDIRYKNEALLMHKQPKGIVVRIFRPGYRVEQGNRSETDLNDYDRLLPDIEYEGPISIEGIPYNFILQNNGNISDLNEKINNKLMPYILSRWKYFV